MGAGDVFAFLGWYSKTLSVFTFLELEAKNTKTRCPCHWPPIGRDLCDAFLRFCVFGSHKDRPYCCIMRFVATLHRDSRLATRDMRRVSVIEIRAENNAC